MIQVYTNPFLLDFVKVAIAMPEDERKQVEALCGHEFDIDSVAVGNFMVPGPKWVIRGEEGPLCVGGFKQQRPGVWRDYMLTTPEAWEKKYWYSVTRTCKRIMDGMFTSGTAHRLECIVPETRLEQRPELLGWYKLMGYAPEGRRLGYCANGADVIAFARTIKEARRGH
jgi:hypothetical protein